MSYINKLCKAADKKKEKKHKQVQQEKKICKRFKKGEDGYCVNYTGAKPCIMSCVSQCKANKGKR